MKKYILTMTVDECAALESIMEFAEENWSPISMDFEEHQDDCLNEDVFDELKRKVLE